jgi:type I restriction enzyme M protein
VRAKDIEKIQSNLWDAAETLRTNSNLASNEYFLPIMGMLFLRHAHHRYLAAKPEIEKHLPMRSGKTRELTKEDFSAVGAILLKPEAFYDGLVGLPNSIDRAERIIAAMESIEDDYPNLKGVLPKTEFKDIENDVLGEILRTLDPEELNNIEGDVFGRIYEFFLTRFAGSKAHDDGEFFTPISLVSFISKMIEVDSGVIFDPACGSGGMFVQSAKLIDAKGEDPTEKLTFLGTEKNATTIRLAKMNLAVHGLEGDIKQANSYYQDPHKMVGKADGLMTNPPFNPDDIDGTKIKMDKKRLRFGLPSINKKGKVTTAGGNYVWISQFHSYLKPGLGRGGFVMASSAASSAGTETKIRQKLIETGDVYSVVTITGGFFYTRPLPCDLWFIDKGRPPSRAEEILMIDARSVYTVVTSTINEFSPEQEHNLLAINWLYKKEKSRYCQLLESYITSASEALSQIGNDFGDVDKNFKKMIGLHKIFVDSIETKTNDKDAMSSLIKETESECKILRKSLNEVIHETKKWIDSNKIEKGMANEQLVTLVNGLRPISEKFESLDNLIGSISRLVNRSTDIAVKKLGSKSSDKWNSKAIDDIHSKTKSSRNLISLDIHRFVYPLSNAIWLTERFSEGKYVDIPGLCKIVKLDELKEQDYSISPVRYVGVVPRKIEDLNIVRDRLTKVHQNLSSLDKEAVDLGKQIQKGSKELLE